MAAPRSGHLTSPPIESRGRWKLDLGPTFLSFRWRRRRDSNSRWTCIHGGFQNRCLRPLGHSSRPEESSRSRRRTLKAPPRRRRLRRQPSAERGVPSGALLSASPRPARTPDPRERGREAVRGLGKFAHGSGCYVQRGERDVVELEERKGGISSASRVGSSTAWSPRIFRKARNGTGRCRSAQDERRRVRWSTLRRWCRPS